MEYHPDKNKSPEAVEILRKIQAAFQTITDPSKRRDYEILGENGVNLGTQMVIDEKYLLIQMIVYYVSTLIFTFLMTFSEPTGDAFQLSLLVLLAMFLIETLTIVQNYALPAHLFPTMTAYQLITQIHRLYPAFMNGCRCLTSAFYADPKLVREKYLEELANTTQDLTIKCNNLIRSVEDLGLKIQAINAPQLPDEANDEEDSVEEQAGEASNDEDQRTQNMNTGDRGGEEEEVGVIEQQLRQRRKFYAQIASSQREIGIRNRIAESIALVQDPQKLIAMMTARNPNHRQGNQTWKLIRNFLIYLVLQYLYRKNFAKQN